MFLRIPMLTECIVSRTIGLLAERINKGASSPPRRETVSSAYYVVSGTGYSKIGGRQFSWKGGDTFCIPSWYEYTHFAGRESVYLYRFDDRPILEALGFYWCEGMDTEALASKDTEVLASI